MLDGRQRRRGSRRPAVATVDVLGAVAGSRRRPAAPSARSDRTGRSRCARRTRGRRTPRSRPGWRWPGTRPGSRGCWAGTPPPGRPGRRRAVAGPRRTRRPGRAAARRSARPGRGSASSRSPRLRRRPDRVVEQSDRMLGVVERSRRGTTPRPASPAAPAPARTGCADRTSKCSQIADQNPSRSVDRPAVQLRIVGEDAARVRAPARPGTGRSARSPAHRASQQLGRSSSGARQRCTFPPRPCRNVCIRCLGLARCCPPAPPSATPGGTPRCGFACAIRGSACSTAKFVTGEFAAILRGELQRLARGPHPRRRGSATARAPAPPARRAPDR